MTEQQQVTLDDLTYFLAHEQHHRDNWYSFGKANEVFRVLEDALFLINGLTEDKSPLSLLLEKEREK